MDPKNRLNQDEAKVNSNIARVRSRGMKLKDEYVTLSHGAGGKASAALVEQVFVSGYGNRVLEELTDAGVLPLTEILGAFAEDEDALADFSGYKLAMSTDSYVVNPIVFPGGSIGELAVNGTVNDLAVSGAIPKVISAGFILEEGLPIADLRREVQAMRDAAETAGVRIVTGDTKVVPKGSGDKLFINTAGIGIVPSSRQLGASQVQRGDRIIVSGAIADHGMSVMMARGDLAIEAPIKSDTRAVNHLVEALMTAVPNTRWMRDATRGGLGTVLNELAVATGWGIAIELGIDPIYVANEGMFCAVVPADQVDTALEALRALPGGEEAANIGRVVSKPESSVVMVTAFGGTRMIDMLVGDPLPRIC